jgi:hypothetical protein
MRTNKQLPAVAFSLPPPLCVLAMAIDRLSVLISGVGVGFGLVHTMLVVVSGIFRVFQDVSGSAVNGHGSGRGRQELADGGHPAASRHSPGLD